MRILCGAKMVSMSVLMCPVHSLSPTEHIATLSVPIGRETLSLACTTIPPPTTCLPLLHDTCDITKFEKLSQKPIVNTMWQTYGTAQFKLDIYTRVAQKLFNKFVEPLASCT